MTLKKPDVNIPIVETLVLHKFNDTVCAVVRIFKHNSRNREMN